MSSFPGSFHSLPCLRQREADGLSVRNATEYVETGNLKYQAEVTIPESWDEGAAVLVAQIPYLVGVSDSFPK